LEKREELKRCSAKPFIRLGWSIASTAFGQKQTFKRMTDNKIYAVLLVAFGRLVGLVGGKKVDKSHETFWSGLFISA
jgi:hypothetical protein